MPSNDPERLYWDADVLLAFINDEENRVEHIRALLTDAQNGEVSIFTSILSVTEVAFAAHEKAEGALSTDADDAISELWKPNSPITRVDFHLAIAQRSRELMREAITRGWKRPKGPDAIHLATAENVEAARLHTYNLADFERWAPVIGMTVENPTSANPQMI